MNNQCVRTLRGRFAAGFSSLLAQSSVESFGSLNLVQQMKVWVAEREGFEPSVAFRLRSLSKGVLSTTQPPFLEAGRKGSIIDRRSRQHR